MKNLNQVLAKGLFILLLAVSLVSCASIPELKLHYQLPPASDQLKGMQVVLTFDDARDIKQILGPGAKKEFKNFSGNISFSVARYKESGFKLGAFGFSGLMREAFKRRLENLGLGLFVEQSPGTPQLLIILREFTLDLVNRRWVAQMNYEARLVKNGEVLAAQTISGQAERYKLIGRREADTALGEIFTDLINKLDVVRLFEQARLIGS